MKPGDKLICIKKGPWKGEFDSDSTGPKYNDIVTFSSYASRDSNYIRIMEHLFDMNGGYQAFSLKWFVPLDDWKQAEYMVEELKEELEVTV